MDTRTTLENIKVIIGVETDDDALRWVQERASLTPLVSLNTSRALLLAGGLRVGDWRAILDQVNATTYVLTTQYQAVTIRRVGANWTVKSTA